MSKDEALTIYGFSQSLLSQNFDAPKPTPPFHLETWEYCCDTSPRVAIAAPRSHAKSTVVTHVFVLYCALFRVNDHILVVSDTETQAIQFLSDIKMELTENEKLIKAFGIQKFIKDTEKEIIFELTGGYRVRIIARGAETSLRGAKWRHKRPNLIVCDDLENDESVMNEERRTKRKAWFLNALMQVTSDNGRVRIVGTILHFDSLLEGLMPVTAGPGMEFTVTDGLKQYSTKPDSQWKSVKYRAHTDFDDFSEILWPEKFSIERLKSIRQDAINAGMPEGYSQEYLNYPITSESAFFRKEDILPMRDEDYLRRDQKQLRYYAAIDPAISLKERRSYTAIVVAGEDPSGMLHIIDVIRDRYDSKEIMDWVFTVQSKYQPDLFIIEQGALEKSLGPLLKDEMFKPGRPFINFLPKTPTKDKRSRARAIQGRMRQGGVRFDSHATWYPSLLEEMLRFDRGAYDDQVDALSWIGLVLNEMIPGKTKEEQEEEEYDESAQEQSDPGRSAVTGY